MIEFAKFKGMHDQGIGPVEAYRLAKNDGLNEIDSILMLRTVYAQTLREAKETTIVASGAASNLDEHEGSVTREIVILLEDKK
jgi:hypothetical protein